MTVSVAAAGTEPPEPWARFADDARSRGRHPSLAIEDAYRSILATHARGSSRAALEALHDLEDRFRFGTDTSCLDKVRRNTLDELARTDPEALLPVLGLYVSLWVENVNPPKLEKAKATRSFIEDYLAVYVGGEVPESAAAASRLLVHWAGLMVGFGDLVLTEGSTDIFERALVHDPANAAALEACSMIYERLGDYKKALALLEKRLEDDPDDSVVRLRIALNRLRSTAKADVKDELDALAHGNAEPWVRILAYQQLAESYAGQGRLADAVRTAQEAHQQFPDSEHVAVQLAFLLGDEGTTLAEQTLDGWRSDRGKSPRLAYEESPAPGVHAMSMLHAGDVGQRLAALGEALERIQAPDGERRRFPSCGRRLKLLQ